MVVGPAAVVTVPLANSFFVITKVVLFSVVAL